MDQRGRVDEIAEIRRNLKTLPYQARELDTRFFRGVEGIRVQLIDANHNPYRAIVAMATSTWGSYSDTADRRWDTMKPEHRFEVVRSVLSGHALPLALEAPKFTFEISNLSRWSFDQIVRARVGFVAASMGTRDNCHRDIAFRMHESTFRDPEKRRSFVANALAAKERYAKVVGCGTGSWQEARTWLPISCCHRAVVSLTYSALKNLCANRMTFSEAEDTVAVAWLFRDRLAKRDAFPYLAAWLRPRCDFVGACCYHRAHTVSEAFGCLYRSCGRNPVRSAPGFPDIDYDCADFNEACSDRETLSKQLGIEIPTAGESRPEDIEFENLSARDKFLFDDNHNQDLIRVGSRLPSGELVEPITISQLESR